MIEQIEKRNGRWNSLSQLRDYIQANSNEKILDFDGITLSTNKYNYTLYNGTIQWSTRSKSRRKTKPS